MEESVESDGVQREPASEAPQALGGTAKTDVADDGKVGDGPRCSSAIADTAAKTGLKVSPVGEDSIHGLVECDCGRFRPAPVSSKQAPVIKRGACGKKPAPEQPAEQEQASDLGKSTPASQPNDCESGSGSVRENKKSSDEEDCDPSGAGKSASPRAGGQRKRRPASSSVAKDHGERIPGDGGKRQDEGDGGGGDAGDRPPAPEGFEAELDVDGGRLEGFEAEMFGKELAKER